MKYVKNGIAPPLTDDDLKWLDRETKKTMWNIEDDQ
jgi:hypothetical protein